MLDTCLLLGAGFSKWSADVPVAAELFDWDIDASARDEPKLQAVRASKELWDSRHPGSYAEEFIADVLTKGLQPQQRALRWYLTRRLSEPFIWYSFYGGERRRRTLSIDESFKRRLPGVAPARYFLEQHLGRAVGIITTNYDLLVEYALGSRKFHYELPGEVLHGAGAHPRRRQPVTLDGATPLAKLHGSISWDYSTRYADGRRSLTGGSLIVAPIPEKTAPRELAAVWASASRILQQSKRVIVFGFAFNLYDKAVLDLLSQAGSGIREVEIYDIKPPFERAALVWPTAEIKSAPLPPEEVKVVERISLKG